MVAESVSMFYAASMDHPDNLGFASSADNSVGYKELSVNLGVNRTPDYF
jgi:hypothetical protein